MKATKLLPILAVVLCVGGIAMMLKGANANVVTQELERRVEKIQKLLPEGVSIEPYLNRSELVNRNISVHLGT